MFCKRHAVIAAIALAVISSIGFPALGSAQEATVLVAPFQGSGGTVARAAAVQGLSEYRVIGHRDAVTAAHRLSVDLDSPAGLATVARELGATLIVFGSIEGQGPTAVTQIHVIDANGTELATEQAPAPVGAERRREIGALTAGAVAQAMEALATPAAPPPVLPSAEPPPSEAPLTAANDDEDEHPMMDRVRLIGTYCLGFGGSVTIGTATGSLSSGARRGHGLHLRLEIPVHDYITIGGILQGSLVDSDAGHASGLIASRVFDASLFIRGRYLFDFGLIGLEPSIAIPVGASMGLFDDSLTGDAVPGWNIGILFGAELLIGRHFGVIFELGFQNHKLKISNHGVNSTFRVKQGVLVLGLLVTF